MKKWIFFVFLLMVVAVAQGQTVALTVPETQTALVTKRTATWCSICGGFAWDMMKRLQADFDSSQAIVLNAHHSSGSRLHSTTAETWIDAFQASFSQPRFYVGTEVMGSGNAGTETDIRERISTRNSGTPVAQSAIAVLYEPETHSLRVQARMSFFQDGAEGSYRLGLYLVERTVMEEQASRGSTVEHRNVLREAITDHPFGTVLHQGAYTAGQSFDTQEFITLADDYNIDNLMFLAVIWEGDAESLSFINATATTRYDLMQTTSIQKREIDGTFRLLTNPVKDQIALSMVFPKVESGLQWQIIGIEGKVWKKGRISWLSAGANTLTLPLPGLSPGYFFLQLRNEKGQQSTFPFVNQ